MKTKKKPAGIKNRIREEKKRERRIGMAITVAVLVAIVLISGFLVNSMLNQPSTKLTVTGQLKAAIVDQASVSPAGGLNEGFRENVSNILEQAGYTVDYYPGEDVTVEFYRNLPKHGYKIVILRVHATATMEEGTEAPVALFTSEFSSQTKYVWEALADQIVAVSYSAEERQNGIRYFGIRPTFVTQSMKGRFQSTTIIMTGCQGLKNTEMGEAFIRRGAEVYIGWDKGIFFFHTDVATIHLLQHFVTKAETIDQAVRNTMNEVGPDPEENATLTYYPPGAGQKAL